MDRTSHPVQSEEFRRLLRYVRSYSGRLISGILLLAFMALVDGLAIFSVRPAVDIVLNPNSMNQRLALFTIPWSGATIYLNSFVPARVHYVWSVFSIALLFLFLPKGLAE